MRAWIENQYGENLCELTVGDEDEFYLPNSIEEIVAIFPAFLTEDDVFRVKVER